MPSQLIVLGMHRSGTSGITRLLNLAGAYFGPADIATEPNEENPKGFWERRGGARTYGAYGSTGLTTILDGSRRQQLMDMENSIAEGSFICGAPETVVKQIKKIAREAGADTFLGEFTFGEFTQTQALNSLRLFTEQVMPELRKFEIAALNYPRA